MTTRTSRRNFIESSILAAGVTMLAPAVLEALAPVAANENSPGQKRLSSFDRRVRALRARMTLEEKIGQMTQAEQNAAVHGADSD